MSDSEQNNINDGEHGARSSTSQASAEREQLLESRRARQIGSTKRNKFGRVTLVGLLLACSALVFIAAVGPTRVMKFLKLSGDDGPKTSQVDLGVLREAEGNQHLDFPVESPPEPAKNTVDPNTELNKRFEEIRKQLDEVARANKGSNVSLDDVQHLMDRYNKEIGQKFQKDIENAKAENERLRAEAQRLQDERKRNDERLKLDAEQQKKLQDITDKQRESNGVIVDESDAHSVSTDSVPQNSADMTSNDRFLSSAAASEVKTSVSRTLPDPSRTIVQGTIISAVLETAINTELPGNIRAQVIEPVFSFNGSRILFPAGTILIGTFSNNVELEQRRVLIAWNRAITPEGKSIAIGSTGTDLLGRAGTLGNVDNRYAKKIGAAVLISAITALPSIIPTISGRDDSSSDGAGTTVNIGGGGSSGAGGGGQAGSEIGGELTGQAKGVLNKYLSLPPILRVPQGEEIRVFVNRDLVIR